MIWETARGTFVWSLQIAPPPRSTFFVLEVALLYTTRSLATTSPPSNHAINSDHYYLSNHIEDSALGHQQHPPPCSQ